MSNTAGKCLGWRQAVSEFCAGVSYRLVTGREYEARLQDLLRHPQCPLAKLAMRIESSEQSAVSLVLGGEHADGGAPTEKWTLDLAGTTWVVEAWRSSLAGGQELIDQAEIRRVVDCYWKSTQRDDRSRLISLACIIHEGRESVTDGACLTASGASRT